MNRLAKKSWLLIPIFILISGVSAFAQDTIRTYYDEESLHIKEILTKVNGKAEGEVRLFDLNGKLILIGTLKNDQRNGFFYDLDADTGDTLRIVQFENNLREGKAVSYFPGGNISQESNFVNNQLEGLVTSYYEDGTVRDRTIFKNNKPEGVSESFFPNGKPKAKISFSAGQYHGPYEEYDEDGNLTIRTNYARGKVDGKEWQYFPSGQVKAQREFRNGELHGAYELNYEEGKPERRGMYKNGQPEGEIIEYFPDGTERMKAFYQKGIPSRPILYFHPDGKLRQRTTYNDRGQKILEENFHSNEVLASAIRFQNNLEEGEVKVYLENGKLLEIRNYTKGRLNGKRELYDESGQLTSTEMWENGNKINK